MGTQQLGSLSSLEFWHKGPQKCSMAYTERRRLGIRKALTGYGKQKAAGSPLYLKIMSWYCNCPLSGTQREGEFWQVHKDQDFLCAYGNVDLILKGLAFGVSGAGFFFPPSISVPSCLPGQCLEAPQRWGKALWMIRNTRWWAKLQHPTTRCGRDAAWKRCGWVWGVPSSQQLHGVHGNLLPAFSAGRANSEHVLAWKHLRNPKRCSVSPLKKKLWQWLKAESVT